MARPVQQKFRHLRAAYRSGLEATVAAALAAAGVAFQYETIKVPFTQPEKQRKYCPDVILENGIVCELKGLFVADDRAKHLLVKAQYPDLDLRLVYSNPNAKLNKGSATTYADWSAKHGFKYAKKAIPTEWIVEPPNEASLAVLRSLGWKPGA